MLIINTLKNNNHVYSKRKEKEKSKRSEATLYKSLQGKASLNSFHLSISTIINFPLINYLEKRKTILIEQNKTIWRKLYGPL